MMLHILIAFQQQLPLLQQQMVADHVQIETES